MKGIEYRGVASVDGPIVVLKKTENVFFGETVCVRDRNGKKRTGRIVDVSEKAVIVQIFGDTTGLDLDETSFEFLGNPLELRVGEGLLVVFSTDLVSLPTVIRQSSLRKKET